MVLVHLLLEWNSSFTVKLCVKNQGWGREGAESIVSFFGIALLVGGQRVVGWGRMSYLGPAEISSFSSQDLSQRNKHDSF